MNQSSQRPVNPQKADQDLNSAMQAGKAGRAGGKLIQIVGVLFVGIGSLIGFNLPILLLGVVLFSLGGWIQHRKTTDMQDQLDRSIVPQVLGAVLEDAQYRPDQSLPASVIESAGLDLPGHTDCGGGQYVKGHYHGAEVELSSITLKEAGSILDDETGMWRDYETIAYQGQWMVCRPGVPMPVDLALLPRGTLDRMLHIQSIKTENEAFNKRFTLQSGNEPAALRYLTPGRMETLLQAADTAGGGLSIRIQTDGTLFAAVQSGHGFFDFGKARETAPQLRERFTRELQWYTHLIDLLRPEAAI